MRYVFLFFVVACAMLCGFRLAIMLMYDVPSSLVRREYELSKRQALWNFIATLAAAWCLFYEVNR